jgi:predicted metal-dependent peptidase
MQTKSLALERALFHLLDSSPFYGSALSMCSIQVSDNPVVPTMAVGLDKSNKTLTLFVNRGFLDRLSEKERCGVLQHEMMHVSHGHMTRGIEIKSPANRIIFNIAADVAINQKIENLPRGCGECNPKREKFLTKRFNCTNKDCPSFPFYPENAILIRKGKEEPLPLNKTTEEYFKLLRDAYENTKKSKEEGDGSGDDKKSQEQGQGQGKGQKQGQGKGQGQDSEGEISDSDEGEYSVGPKDKNKDSLSKDLYDQIKRNEDYHNWGANGDAEGDIDDLEKAVEDLIKRTIQKTQFDYSKLPKEVQDYGDYLLKKRAVLDYKKILYMAIKKSASAYERKSTWARRNKRYKFEAPGTTNDSLPKLDFYIDTSGSISVEEIHTFLGVVDGFLRVGDRTCQINLFHTDNYHNQKYRTGDRSFIQHIRCGGTDLSQSLQKVYKTQPDLAIFLTDGHYDDGKLSCFSKKDFPKVVFCVTDNQNHGYAERPWAQTIKIPGNH